MKIICTQENLKVGITMVARIIAANNTLPILNNLLLKTENGLLHLVATNLELAISTTVRCKIEQEGSVCLPAKTILDLVQNLPSTNISLEKSGQTVLITADQFKTKLVSLSTDEFPLIPKLEAEKQFSINTNDLGRSLELVVFAATVTETQPEISGVLLRFSDKSLTLVATDRYRLAEHKLNIDTNGLSRDIIVPQKTIHELIRIIGQANDSVEIQVAETQIGFVCKDTTLTSRLVDGTYPEYQQIIPKEFTSTAVLTTKAFLQAVRTSSIFSRTTNSILVQLKPTINSIVVSAASSDVGETEVEVKGTLNGPEQTITLNYRYISDVLSVLSAEEVSIKLVNDSAPVVLTSEGQSDYLYLIMPIKS